MSDGITRLPAEQQALRAKCFHPSGVFVEFSKEEIEQSIPERFEKIARQYPNRLAVKVGERSFTYDELNRWANRKDSQVKIRGYRVEVAEIEGALLTHHPQVSEAGVVAWERVPGEKYMVAYVVPRQTPPPTIDEFYDFLKTKLPDYMLPPALVFLKSLPLTNGKLDRSALPLPGHKRPDLKQPYAASQNILEQQLVQIWEEVLDVRPIGIYDSFFDLGGHSLGATRLVSKVIKQFQLELPLQSLFQSPTIAAMVAIITEHKGKKIHEKELGRILTELELLTDEEAKRLLANENET